MDENELLQARIAALSGRIEQRKQHQQPYSSPAPSSHAHSFTSPPQRGTHRWSPYHRGGRAGHQMPHKNRTLVLNGAATTPSSVPNGPTSDTTMKDATSLPPVPKTAFVSTRGAGTNQLMTKNTFEREQKQKLGIHEPQATKRPETAVPSVPKPFPKSEKASAPKLRAMEIDGIQFQMLNDGSKLLRLSSVSTTASNPSIALNKTEATNNTKQTPKRVKIADVEFFRTKRGNLVRASTVPGCEKYVQRYCDAVLYGQSSPDRCNRPVKRAQKPQCEHFTKHGTYIPPDVVVSGRAGAKTSRCPFCEQQARTCPFGPSCRFSHDPMKVAICKDFLRNGTCPAGKNCDLSHEPTYHRVSACTHFLRGNCTNSACRYPHLHVSPAAPVCRPFATLGFCSKGPECDKRHVFECPDYSNRGRCANHEKGACPLPHVDRASTLRKAAERKAKAGTEAESDVSSDDEEKEKEEGALEHDSDAIDSDIDMLAMSNGDTSELDQQQDFIAFE